MWIQAVNCFADVGKWHTHAGHGASKNLLEHAHIHRTIRRRKSTGRSKSVIHSRTQLAEQPFNALCTVTLPPLEQTELTAQCTLNGSPPLLECALSLLCPREFGRPNSVLGGGLESEAAALRARSPIGLRASLGVAFLFWCEGGAPCDRAISDYSRRCISVAAERPLS